MLASTRKSFRWSLSMLLIVGIGATAATSVLLDRASADQPPQELKQPRFDPVMAPAENDAVKVKIRQALENPAEAKATGDVLLDGFIDVIRQQGSLVDQRLSKFPQNPLPAGEPPAAQPLEMQQANIFPQVERMQTSGQSSPEAPAEQPYLLAEQLLRTARLLNHDPNRGERKRLIRMLREEAARCLNNGPPVRAGLSVGL